MWHNFLWAIPFTNRAGGLQTKSELCKFWRLTKSFTACNYSGFVHFQQNKIPGHFHDMFPNFPGHILSERIYCIHATKGSPPISVQSPVWPKVILKCDVTQRKLHLGLTYIPIFILIWLEMHCVFTSVDTVDRIPTGFLFYDLKSRLFCEIWIRWPYFFINLVSLRNH